MYPPGSELQLRNEIITPVLEHAVKCSSTMVVESSKPQPSMDYVAYLTFEVKTEERRNRPGRKPSVDCALCAWLDNEDLLYEIPIEVKYALQLSDMSQLCHYMSCTSSARITWQSGCL